MNFATYKSSLKQPLRQRTLSHLVRDGKLLLGYKKTGFGKGYLVGIGGKVEKGETLEGSAAREIEEEIKVKVSKFVPMGYLNFYFPHVTDESWNQKVHIYIVHEWIGEPQETEEIRPEWYDLDRLPLDKMWDDDRYWLQDMLDGNKIQREFLFDSNLRVVEWRENE
jgi:8-oxo-dGTP pyrophosphatase MutT (NUDIX family)